MTMEAEHIAPERRTRPKYRRLADALLREIEQGVWKPGDRLPSESALAETSDASLGTVQKALNHLAEQGILQRQHGRGTFVSGQPAPGRDLRHFRFLGEDGQSLLPIYPHVLAVERVQGGGPWSTFLGPEPFYVRIDRVIDVGSDGSASQAGEFGVFAELFLPGGRFESLLDLTAADLDGMLIREVLDRRFDTPTLTVEHRLGCGMLPPRVCRRLSLPSGTVGTTLILRGRTWRDQPATWQRLFIPPTDRELELPSVQIAPGNDPAIAVRGDNGKPSNGCA